MKFFLLAATALMITGCSSSDPDPDPVPGENGQAIEIENDAAVPLPPPAEPDNAVVADNAAISDNAVEPPPEAPTAIDEQMQDDAAATGMTARANRDSDADAANVAE